MSCSPVLSRSLRTYLHEASGEQREIAGIIEEAGTRNCTEKVYGFAEKKGSGWDRAERYRSPLSQQDFHRPEIVILLLAADRRHNRISYMKRENEDVRQRA